MAFTSSRRKKYWLGLVSIYGEEAKPTRNLDEFMKIIGRTQEDGTSETQSRRSTVTSVTLTSTHTQKLSEKLQHYRSLEDKFFATLYNTMQKPLPDDWKTVTVDARRVQVLETVKSFLQEKGFVVDVPVTSFVPVTENTALMTPFSELTDEIRISTPADIRTSTPIAKAQGADAPFETVNLNVDVLPSTVTQETEFNINEDKKPLVDEAPSHTGCCTIL